MPTHLNIQNGHQEDWLPFTTEHINIGDGPLQVRPDSEIGPCVAEGVAFDACTLSTQEVLDAAGNVAYTQDAGLAVFHPEHDHWHQDAVGDFILHAGSLDGPVVTSIDKQTYGLIEYDETDRVHANNTRVYYDCDGATQGISV